MKAIPAPYRRLLRILAPFVLIIGAEVLFLHPLIGQMGRALHDRSDTTLNTWILNWQAHMLIREPWALFDAPIFYPLRNTLALSEILWPAAPLAVPLLAATGNPILVYNVLYLASFLLAGAGMYLLALHLTRSRPAALLAGLLYAFSPYQFYHFSQLQLINIGWLPLTLLFLDRYWTRGRTRDGFLLAFCVASQTLSAFYYGFQVVLIIGLYLVIQVLTQPGRARYRRLGQGVAWLALAALLIAPFALPYLEVRAGLGLERSLQEAFDSSASLAEYAAPPAGNPLYGGLVQALGLTGGRLFVGIAPLTLAAIGFCAWPRRARHGVSRAFLLAAGTLALVLALGPSLKLTPDDAGRLTLPFAWLFAHVPGMTVIRAPIRFSVTVFFMLALAAAAGLGWVLRRIRRPTLRAAAWGLLVVVCLAENSLGHEVFSVQAMPALDPAPPVYAWLAAQPQQAIVELPLSSDMATAPSGPTGTDAFQAWPDYNTMRYQYFNLVHWQPSIDGFSGFRPPHHRELGLTLTSFPDDRSVTLLRGLGVETIVVHSQLMESVQPGRAAALRARIGQMPGLAHGQDFGTDWVYRVLPAATAPITGHFWSADAGYAALILASQDRAGTVIRPGAAIQVVGSWQPEGSAPLQSFTVSPVLPLIVGEGSVLPLALPRPAAPGRYTLRLRAEAAGWTITPYEGTIEMIAGAAPTQVLPLRAETFPATRHLTPGATQVTLAWRLLDRPAGDASVSLKLHDAAGQVISASDVALGGSFDLVREWRPGLVVTTTHTIRLPADAAGLYQFETFLYRPNDATRYLLLDAQGEPVASLRWPVAVRREVTRASPLPPPAPLAVFEPGLYLVGFTAQPPLATGQAFGLTMAWVAENAPDTSYTLFAHLVDPAGNIVAQQDQQPLHGQYPTSVWEPGEVVSDTLAIDIPGALGGQTVCLRLGLYDAATSTRPARRNTQGDFWQPKTCWTLP